MTPSCDYTLETVRIIIVTGLSGSGKSIAVRQLEDSGYYCVDNLPIGFLVSVVQSLAEHGHTRARQTGHALIAEDEGSP